jgi:transposase
MEKRRLRSVRLFEKGSSGAEVARRLGVARQVAHRWRRAWEVGCKGALVIKGQAGPKPKIDATARQRVVDALLAGPKSQVYKTELWTLPRVSVRISKLTGVRYHRATYGACLGAWGSPARGRSAAPWSAVKKPSAHGSAEAGRL